MILKYPDFVITEKIKCEEDDNYRYFLKIPFSSEPKNILAVILKNPSTATARDSDVTADRVVNYAYRHGFDCVIIVNLFAYRSTFATELTKVAKDQGKGKIIGDLNDDYILSAVKKANQVIFAWGNPPAGLARIYKERIKFLEDKLERHFSFTDINPYYVHSISKGGYPLHGQVWGYNMDMKKYISSVK